MTATLCIELRNGEKRVARYSLYEALARQMFALQQKDCAAAFVRLDGENF